MMCCTSGVTPAATVELHAEVSRPFVFAHVEHEVRYDNPGFLTGAAGVALALAEHAGVPGAPVTTSWDALLLLS